MIIALLASLVDESTAECVSAPLKKSSHQFAHHHPLCTGKLPNFTWLQPQSTTYGRSLANWQHPDASVIEGKD